MSSIIKFDIKELKRLSTNNQSCVEERKVTRDLALQPWCLGNLTDSIKKTLDYKIGKFDEELNGILLSYINLRILQNFGAIRNDKADIHFQIQADFFIFKPYIGAILKGIVNKKSNQHLGVLVHRVFNVVIPRPTEAPGNKWIGSQIKEGQEVVFKIVILDLYGALPYIRGELDEQFLNINDDEDSIDNSNNERLNIVSHVHFENIKPKSSKNNKVIKCGDTSSMISENKKNNINDSSISTSSEIIDDISKKNRKRKLLPSHLEEPEKDCQNELEMPKKKKKKRQKSNESMSDVSLNDTVKKKKKKSDKSSESDDYRSGNKQKKK